ncbi:hypothetical protein LTR56_016758 [Elasticomyces elasticus]|nr:hypothetical protein LTR56_016758 [Elasticomyces elasticus]KAK3662725.1 hypothetical protein LTR22_006576 [Elasticomyces elasticus]KAK4923375.1 hypothetical protein LTR49_009445 [Elasticomyces elasticus]KAK5753280.1 hypothetical protein LTS12_016616 [Elasticomyces elasticus]
MPSLRDQLIGAWELVEYSAFPPSSPGEKIYPYGRERTRHHNSPFASGDMNGGTTEELAEAGRKYFAYTGQFWLDESGDEPILMHEMRCSSFPNWLGNVQRRIMKLSEEGGEQFLALGPEKAVEVMGEVRMTRLVWRRLPDNLAERPT